jgi:TRAP-type C4-dicarboxylate transport system substrate-binding protein
MLIAELQKNKESIMTKKITWVLAHEPYEVFHKAAGHFANEVRAETNGAVDIEVLDLPDYNVRAGTNLTTAGQDRQTIVDMVNNGTVDMATVYVNNLATINRDLYVWGMPFLTQDMDHAIAALDGDIGQSLLAGVATKSNVKPLAYTFSGGFRTMPGMEAIESIDDFANLRVRCGKNPVSVDMFNGLNATPVSIGTEDFASMMMSGELDAGEATYPRFFLLGFDRAAKYINHTEHNLFLTSIVTNQTLWNSFDARTQAIFAEAARHAAEMERAESLASISQVQTAAAKMGIPTVTMTSKERQRFIDATAGMYDKYNTWFSAGVLQGLKQVH